MLYFFEAVVDFPTADVEKHVTWWHTQKSAHRIFSDHEHVPVVRRALSPVMVLIEPRKVVIYALPHIGVLRASFDRVCQSLSEYQKRFPRARPIGFTYATREPVGSGEDAGITSSGGWVFVARGVAHEESSLDALIRFQEKFAKDRPK